ncbi:HNH endonuclease signature motif containing protein [Pediococcus pentosaceus]|uniref:HNH endonuclease signature motif containing protein n=1 Tax=Pediococcus pentosaceus TaxID=1255 RepID=UPI00232C57B4|nr:HNH endonuclease signature motif containing protein [Pediococcus pentosaceus]MDB1562943.1 HNH endonuclease signature motif containing protein [Pediococcus pentosaceus]
MLIIENSNELKQIEIKGEKSDLFIDNKGQLYRRYPNEFKSLKPTYRKYVEYKTTFHGKYIHFLGHRLVAEYFVDGRTKEKNVVHHVDRNTHNNDYRNLRWVSQRENVRESYTAELGPVRNFITLKLYENGEYVDTFKSIRSASNYVSSHGGSKTGFMRNKKTGNFTMIKCEETTENIAS